MAPKVDYVHCDGCKVCYNTCPMDIYGWDETTNQPVVAYPDECCYCGICELDCPQWCIDVEMPASAWQGWDKAKVPLVGPRQGTIPDRAVQAEGEIKHCEACGDEITGELTRKVIRGIPHHFCSESCYVFYRFDVPAPDRLAIYEALTIPVKLPTSQA